MRFYGETGEGASNKGIPCDLWISPNCFSEETMEKWDGGERSSKSCDENPELCGDRRSLIDQGSQFVTIQSCCEIWDTARPLFAKSLI
jgi:hypothetical protein